MKHLHIQALTILFFVLLLVGFSSCEKKSRCNVIRIGVLEGPSAVSFIKMLDEKPTIGDKKVEIIIRSEPFQIQAMMLKNELDFAVLPTIMAANSYNKGLKYRMIACPIWGTLYIMTNNSEIQTLYDLKDEEIAVFGQNSTADILARRMIKIGELECKGFNYRFNTNQEVAHALLAREVKVAIVSEPLVSSLMAKDSNIRIVEKLNFNGYVEGLQKDYFVQSAFLVSDYFIQHYSHLIPQVCSAYVESCNFVNENPKITAQLMVKYNITPNIEIAAKSIELCNIQYVAAFAIMRELHHYLQTFYLENPESIGRKIPEQDFVYQTYSALSQ